MSCNYSAPVPQLLKPACPRACALQQEKPHNEKIMHHNERVAPPATTRESPRAATKIQGSQYINKIKNKGTGLPWWSSG